MAEGGSQAASSGALSAISRRARSQSGHPQSQQERGQGRAPEAVAQLHDGEHEPCERSDISRKKVHHLLTRGKLQRAWLGLQTAFPKSDENESHRSHQCRVCRGPQHCRCSHADGIRYMRPDIKKTADPDPELRRISTSFLWQGSQ